jgi:hypothetical protein
MIPLQWILAGCPDSYIISTPPLPTQFPELSYVALISFHIFVYSIIYFHLFFFIHSFNFFFCFAYVYNLLTWTKPIQFKKYVQIKWPQFLPPVHRGNHYYVLLIYLLILRCLYKHIGHFIGIWTCIWFLFPFTVIFYLISLDDII